MTTITLTRLANGCPISITLLPAATLNCAVGTYAITGSGKPDGTLRNRTVKIGDEARKRQVAIDNAFLLAS